MPKRKAATKLSGLVDDDVDDEELLGGEDAANEGGDIASPPAKRQKGRPKGAAGKATGAKPATRKTRSTVVVGPKKRAPARRTARDAQKVADANAEVEDAAETGALENDGDEDEGDGHNGVNAPDLSSGDDELTSPRTASLQETRTKTRGPVKGPARRVTLDDEFEYTPTGSRMQIAPNEPSEGPEPRIEETQAEIEETIFPDEAQAAPSSPSKSSRGRGKQFTTTQVANQRRRGVSASDTEKGESDATLRRKLGDMTKKYETMETRYRNLREVGIVEANANVEKLRKQCEATTAASNNLIASLKKELAVHSAAAKQSRTLQKQLQDRDTQVSKLEKQIADMSSNLASSQNEVKTLQTKLSAARSESAQARVPGSATKNGTGSRAGIAGNAEAAQAAQIAQLKEDLYSDLTGLIIRDVKRKDSDEVYDCIQTGINGTLHFKLAVAQDTDSRTTTSFETAELHYMPQLDPNRDRDLKAVLPDYLSVDITFSRQHAAKFYSRVVDTLTKRYADG